ncbi:phosphoglycerate mutase-like protein [Daldinia bambusicola]|nr:phosphoglycerate mutase-like protein [Daldinia bambusicola]
MTTPRVFVVRHGETEWSLSGKHTSITDIPLTANGEKRVKATGRALVGDDRLIVPKQIAHIYVSPRKRAQRTFELLNLGIADPLPWKIHGAKPLDASHPCNARVEVTEDIREWDYGAYEGITSPEIREIRVKQGLTERWDIWRDGCVGGESPEDVTNRVDSLIREIREKWHAPVIGKSQSEGQSPGDVLLVAHGHILRAFAMSYEHHNINEPAILLGGAFVVSPEK